ncbi:MAG TPA: hypothetical protein VHW96_19735 [Solirubrobacteraceae bacterium]|jgi:hypothetical protein|nr:hypothetical protein [Solirubrobacteraceae bacterium]
MSIAAAIIAAVTPDRAPRSEPVRRSAGWVQREYGREKWRATLAAAEEYLAGDDPRSLGRAVERVARGEQFAEVVGMQSTTACLGEGHVTVPRAVAVGAWRALVVEAVLARCAPPPELIVELGSGWGRNLFDLWRCGAPPGARYVAAELTEAGRATTERLAALAPEMSLATLAFDLRAPDLSAIRVAGRAVVFTAYAIQQVPRVSPALVPAIAAIAPEVTVVHFEDAGWQIRGEDTKGSSETYAGLNDYNRDLYPTLRAAQSRGEIEILATIVDVVGINPADAASVIVWRPASAGS